MHPAVFGRLSTEFGSILSGRASRHGFLAAGVRGDSSLAHLVIVATVWACSRLGGLRISAEQRCDILALKP